MGKQRATGNGRTLAMIGGLVTIGLASVAALSSSIGANDAAIDTHEKLQGHPVLIERVDSIGKKLEGIEETQHEQSGMLRQILTEVEKG